MGATEPFDGGRRGPTSPSDPSRICAGGMPPGSQSTHRAVWNCGIASHHLDHVEAIHIGQVKIAHNARDAGYVLTKLLEMMGQQVRTATDAPAALESVRRSAQIW